MVSVNMHIISPEGRRILLQLLERWFSCANQVFHHLVWDLMLSFERPMNPGIPSHFDFPALEILTLKTKKRNLDYENRGQRQLTHRFCQQRATAPPRRYWGISQGAVTNTTLFAFRLRETFLPSLEFLMMDLPVKSSKSEATAIADIVKSK